MQRRPGHARGTQPDPHRLPRRPLLRRDPGNAASLRAEGISADRITLTGSTIIEAVRLASRDPGAAAAALGLPDGEPYILATAHRPENTDAPDRLAAILTALVGLAPRRPPAAPPPPRPRPPALDSPRSCVRSPPPPRSPTPPSSPPPNTPPC
ncbi:UDP-N-acetylglucosamine 2-epimerase [Actinomadura sp. NEAU-AAG7]|nr:UDP-N-acetylglucosamine 2-epimerase [Actinomadura sp. NEAU-AAG7]